MPYKAVMASNRAAVGDALRGPVRIRCLLSNAVWGLRIHDLQRQSVALKIRWLWQNGTSPKKPWSGLSIPIDKEIKALFCASTTWIIGNGTSISFWNDHWLEGNSPANLYQILFKHSKRRNLTLSDALQHRRWISLIKASPNEAVLREYVDLWRARNQLF